MHHQTRRQFLGAAALAGVATAYGPLSLSDETVAQAVAQDAGVSRDDVDPTFFMGKIVALGTNDEVSLVNLDGALQQLKLLPSSTWWKEGVWNQSPVAVGDCVFGGGEHLLNGGMLVDELWANIMNRSGEVLDVNGLTLSLLNEAGVREDFRLTETTVVEGPLDTERVGDFSSITSGQDVLVIGFGDPATGALTATRIVAFPPAGTAAPEGPLVLTADESDVLDKAGNWVAVTRGLASFFCCNPHPADSFCGWFCGRTNDPSCASLGCRSDNNHIAWPKLKNGCTAGCVSCCLDNSFPRFACDKKLFLFNNCTYESKYGHVRDCGPNPKCAPNDCCCSGHKSIKRKLDLTPCLFKGLGGKFDRGFIHVLVAEQQ